MKKIFICFLLIFTVLTTICADESELKRLVILNLTPLGVDPAICEAATECLITSVVKTNKYQVVERTQLNKILSELSLTSSDEFEDSTVLEIGYLAKARMIVVGAIGKVEKEFMMSVRIIEVETGNVLYADSSFAKSLKELLKVTDDIAYKMLNKEAQSQYQLEQETRNEKNHKAQRKLEKKLEKHQRKEAKEQGTDNNYNNDKKSKKEEKRQKREERKQERKERKEEKHNK
ncbi:MAG: hypothetical protein J6W76_04710 [Spirochaetales bacterium]|nr:hypothetical protein [Spirochaetales bacterium]